MTPFRQTVDLVGLLDAFDTDKECREYLAELRWPEGVRCLRCDSPKIANVYVRKLYACGSCKYRFSVINGTIFGDTHLPLPKWFLAIFLMGESRKGVSANQLRRMLKISYKTAWFLCHRIRQAMSELAPAPLSGTVEVDETYIGGRRRHVGHGYKRNKKMVLAAIQRSGAVRMRVAKTNDRKTLHGFVGETCAPETENIYTDDWEAYRGLADGDTKHETVKHTEEEWVRGDVHTNTVEGVFSLFKRSLIGAFHQVSAKHLDRYLDEFEFRFNNRKNAYLFRDTVLRLLKTETLRYKQLTA